ncbi:MAG: hypothetical protein ACRCWR_03575, partial [Saezia sp.]
MNDTTNPTPPKKQSSTTGLDTNTKQVAEGAVLEVEDAKDLWYLCQKIDYANANPITRADGGLLRQRVVTIMIQRDNAFLRYNFPWTAEVGYDMTTDPPSPIMSLQEPWRPSTFPLSQYQRIIDRYMASMPTSVKIEQPLVTLTELEEQLLHPEEKRTGLMRIPDVLSLKDCMMAGCPAKYSKDNINSVIEIKFPGDQLSRKQRQAYELIAGDANNFRLMRTERCGHRRRRRDWEEEVKANSEPVFSSVRNQLAQSASAVSSMHAYPLIEDMIKRENHQVRIVYDEIYLQQQNIPVMRDAGPMLERQRQQEEQRRRAQAQIEMVLAAPFALAAIGVAALPLGGTT